MPLGFEPQSHSNVRAVVVDGAVLLVEVIVIDWVEEEVEVGLGGLVGLVVTTSQDVALHLQMQPSGILGGHLGFSVVVVIDDEVEIGVELVVDWVEEEVEVGLGGLVGLVVTTSQDVALHLQMQPF